MEDATTPASTVWKGRPKRRSRRFARDLRLAMPGVAILVCFGATASMIAAAESIPMHVDVSNQKRMELPSVSASAPDSARLAEHDASATDASAKAGPAGVTPDCVRTGLFDDFE